MCWVFVSVRGLSPVVVSRGQSSSRCAGLSPSRPLLLRSTGSRRAGSVVVAHGLSRSAACGIFPDQGSNPCPLHWQADSQPLRRQGSPTMRFWYSSLCMYKIALSCWSLNFKCISNILHLYYPHDFWFWYHICMWMISCLYVCLPLLVGFSICHFLVSSLAFSFLLREVPLAFVAKLVWWCWILLAFACL